MPCGGKGERFGNRLSITFFLDNEIVCWAKRNDKLPDNDPGFGRHLSDISPKLNRKPTSGSNEWKRCTVDVGSSSSDSESDPGIEKEIVRQELEDKEEEGGILLGRRGG